MFDKEKGLFRSSTEIFLFILLVALIFRIDVYSVAPYCDEETYDWLAYNLSQGRLRTGSAYTNIYAQLGAGNEKDGVEPWLDHPILYPLVISALKKLAQLFFNTDLTFYNVRLASILLFCLPTIYLAMLVCKKNFGICAAAISGLIYATSPSIILQQKMVFLDHGVAFFSLLAVYALTMYSTSGCNKWWIFASVFAGLASLCKGTGISAVFAVAITIILNTEDMLKIRVAKGISSLVIGGSLFLVYPLYGYIFNPKLLSAIVSIRSSTIFSAEWFVRSLFEYPWSYERIYDWFLLIGWVAVAYTLVISLREKRINTIVIWLACYLFTLVFIAKGAFYYSQIVLYPFLCILIGKMSTDVLRYVDSLRFKRACVD